MLTLFLDVSGRFLTQALFLQGLSPALPSRWNRARPCFPQRWELAPYFEGRTSWENFPET